MSTSGDDAASTTSSMTSGGGGGTRMLERRVSNNRSDLNADGQINYFLSWFNEWTELQRSDFVPVLSSKFSSCPDINGLSSHFQSLNGNGGSTPPSLYQCQIKLFNDWFSGWSDDQKNYLTLRLKDIDTSFFQNYENYDPETNNKHKDYFEPGVPEHLVRKKSSDSISPAPAPRKTSGDKLMSNFNESQRSNEVCSPIPE